ncbi:MAG: hypothetical protein AABZ30_11815 [Myxococcota bacterium]
MRTLSSTLILATLSSLALAEPVTEATKHLKGRVAIDDKEFPDKQGKDLAKYFEERLTARKVKRDTDGLWSVYFYAVFNKEAVKGPITILLYDKADPVGAVDVKSIPSEEKTWTFRNVIALDENLGFNKAHTYELRIGQLFGKQAKIYAKGEVTLE